MNYQGYKNYETFLVHTCIVNDSEQATYWETEALVCFECAKPEHGSITPSDAARFALGDLLKQWHEENAPDIDGLWASLLNASMDRIGWDEIADLLLEKVEGYEKHHFPWDAEPV